MSLSECVINTNAYQDEATDAERIRLEFKALIRAWLAGIDLVLEEAGDDEEVLAQLKANAAQSDRKIVEVASDRKWIIVTANGDDFIAEIRRYLRQSRKLVCHDLSGLVTIPNGHQLQEHVLPKDRGAVAF